MKREGAAKVERRDDRFREIREDAMATPPVLGKMDGFVLSAVR